MGRYSKIPTSDMIYAKVLSSKDAKSIALSGNWLEFLKAYSPILPEHQVTRAYNKLRSGDLEPSIGELK